jgi:tetratricopeptide (TPR) repeat protein/serine phosphatase RsbU (regulator of sigma subunit)
MNDERSTMNYRKYLYVFLFIVYSSSFIVVNAQEHKVDSLRKILKAEKEDTNKVNTLNFISYTFWKNGQYDSAMTFACLGQGIAQKLEFKNGVATACVNMGLIYHAQGNFLKALEFDSIALDLERKMGNKKSAASIIGSIGIVYDDQGNYPKALQSYFGALKIDQESGEKYDIGRNYCNIGLVYEEQGNYQAALDYDFKALAINKALQDNNGIAGGLGNIGNLYAEKAQHSNNPDSAKIDYNIALEFDFKALNMTKEMGDLPGVAINLSNIGGVYDAQANYTKALEYQHKALEMEKEMGDKHAIASILSSTGILYIEQKNYKQAKAALDSALKMAMQIGEKDDIKYAYNELSVLDTAVGNYKNAYQDYKMYIIYRDSLFNESNTKKSVQTEMNFEFEQKQAVEKAEQDKKDVLTAADKKRQSIITASVSVVLLLVVLFSVLLFSRFRVAQKQKQLIEEQKLIVEEKNKEVLDSITYAKRLQDAILPPLGIINKYLPESFVLYKPKDIVAGDFYWMEKAGDNILLAAADCTGHGVPGAMVSVVCSNALNRTVKEFKITEPGKILDKVRELVLETFEKSEDNVQDGMDISLCCINIKTKEAQWSGAYNSLWYITKGEMKEVPADKQPIGKVDKPMAFNTHNLNLQKGDSLYLFTDGYADQFGGPKGKKFKYKQLEELLMVNCKLSMPEQKQKLEQTLESWKGSLEQVDDILIIGIRV